MTPPSYLCRRLRQRLSQPCRFRQTPSVYALEQRLSPAVLVHSLVPPITPIAQQGDQFGNAVAMAGKYLVVGAPGDDTGASRAGAAYVYDLDSNTARTPIATLLNPTPSTDDEFGSSVAVTANLLVVGAAHDDTGATDAGSAYVYSVGSKTPLFTLNNPSPASGDLFGYSVSIAGKYVVVGAYQDDTGANDAGLAYVYDLTSPTSTTPIVTLSHPAAGDGYHYGYSVGISGNYVVVGAPDDNFIGSTFVYDLNSPTPATPIATLYPAATLGTHSFGSAVAVSGGRVVVGVNQGAGPSNYPAAYVYDVSSPTPTLPIAMLHGSSTFGGGSPSVAVAGNYVVVGAHNEYPNDAASVFDLNSPTPTVPIAILQNPMPGEGDYFGYSVAVSSAYAVIGTPFDDTQNTDQGAAYVFNHNLAPPKVASFIINNGEIQRSEIRSLRVEFDDRVTFSGAPASAFQIKRQSDSAIPNLIAEVNDNGPRTLVTLSFTGTTAVDFASLADGWYTLTIFADKVGNTNGPLDGNGDGTGGDDYVLMGNTTNKFFRFFGDGNGDGRVDGTDFQMFRTFFGTAGDFFDFNNDGIRNSFDFGEFRKRFGLMI